MKVYIITDITTQPGENKDKSFISVISKGVVSDKSINDVAVKTALGFETHGYGKFPSG